MYYILYYILWWWWWYRSFGLQEPPGPFSLLRTGRVRHTYNLSLSSRQFRRFAGPPQLRLSEQLDGPGRRRPLAKLPQNRKRYTQGPA